MNKLKKEITDVLKSKISGNVIVPADSNYEETRKIWNAMIDRKPAIIVQCKNADDVVEAIQFARSNQLENSIRGGGHNIAGSSLCDDGLLIDFSTMKNVKVDTQKKRAFVEPGATLADFDEETQKYGLATPTGINSTTGIAGLTLGGGFGWLSRKYGLTIDNLISVEIVTAEGKKLKASEDENQDLFWAVRGGGGNFGAVTLFEFKLHVVGPEILAGLIVYPIEQAKKVLEDYSKFVSSSPVELAVWVVLRQAPPLPFLPEEVHGKKVIVLAICYNGNIDKGKQLIKPLRDFGDIYGEMVAPMPYSDWQKMFDPLLAPGSRNYWKTHNLIEIKDKLLDEMIDYVEKLPTQQCEIFIGSIEGVLNKIDSGATAWYHRNVKYIMNVHCRWEKPSDDKRCIEWGREFFKVSKPYASAGAYVNFMTEEEKDRIKSAYGKNYDRLLEIKRKYDPENMFHNNQNIKPH